MNKSLEDIAAAEITELISLLEKKVSAAESDFRSKTYSSSFDTDINNVRNVQLIRGLRNVVRFSIFLLEKVNSDPKNAQFYLAQLRTMAEIVVKLIYLLSIDTVDAARVIVCEDLITMQKLNSTNFETSYEEARLINNSFLFLNEWFPLNANVFCKTKLKKIQKEQQIILVYPEFKDLLNINFIEGSTKMAKEFTSINFTEMVTHIWKSFSEHVHGNHLFNTPQGNEVLWINLQNISLLVYTIEIVDSQILHKERAADTRVRFQQTRDIGKMLVADWHEKMNNN